MSDSHAKKRATMAATLASKTGRSVDEWIAHLTEAGPSDDKAWQAWLKTEGLGHFQARLVVAEARARR